MTSTFGPRWKPNEQRFDFHRGIDFFGTLGEPIFATAGGEVYRVYDEGNKVYPNGGNTIIIRHALENPFPLHGQTIEQYFSVYLHLAEVGLRQGEAVAQGQQVAEMGQSGSTVFTHLHFEVRLQTTCSLEYQTKHPRASCAVYGFDPHVHPFLFLERPQSPPFSLRHFPGTPFVVRYEAPNSRLDLNEVRTDQGVLNFNLRTGIDAATTRSLDRFDYGWVKMFPGRFSGRNQTIAYTFEFPAKPQFVEMTDIFGCGIRRAFH